MAPDTTNRRNGLGRCKTAAEETAEKCEDNRQQAAQFVANAVDRAILGRLHSHLKQRQEIEVNRYVLPPQHPMEYLEDSQKYEDSRTPSRDGFPTYSEAANEIGKGAMEILEDEMLRRIRRPHQNVYTRDAQGELRHGDYKMNEYSLLTEEWREYDIPGRDEPYRITDPHKLFIREGGSTHRVLDKNGVVHCVPTVGVNGCVLRWKNKDPENTCEF